MARFGKAYSLEFFRQPSVVGSISESIQVPYLAITSDQINMLRVSFHIRKSNSVFLSSNTMKLSIYNLTQGTREAIKDYGDYVVFRAGWRGTPLPIVYQGSIIAANHKVDPPDAVTEINCLDESASIRNLTINRPKISLASNTNILEAINSIVSKNNLSLSFEEVPVDAQLQSGYASGDKTVMQILQDLANRAECSVSVLDGKLFIYKPSLADTKLPLNGYFVLSEQTGMIGYPQRFGYNSMNPIFFGTSNKTSPSTWRVESQLNGDIRLFGGVRIISPALKVVGQDGIVIALTHSGDTHGGTWKTTADIFEKL